MMYIKQVAVMEESPEFRRALKFVIKHQIQVLLKQLSDSGEESVVITASVADGTASHLGSSKAEGFLQQKEELQSQFLTYCSDEEYKSQSLSVLKHNRGAVPKSSQFQYKQQQRSRESTPLMDKNYSWTTKAQNLSSDSFRTSKHSPQLKGSNSGQSCIKMSHAGHGLQTSEMMGMQSAASGSLSSPGQRNRKSVDSDIFRPPSGPKLDKTETDASRSIPIALYRNQAGMSTFSGSYLHKQSAVVFPERRRSSTSDVESYYSITDRTEFAKDLSKTNVSPSHFGVDSKVEHTIDEDKSESSSTSAGETSGWVDARELTFDSQIEETDSHSVAGAEVDSHLESTMADSKFESDKSGTHLDSSGTQPDSSQSVSILDASQGENKEDSDEDGDDLIIAEPEDVKPDVLVTGYEGLDLTNKKRRLSDPTFDSATRSFLKTTTSSIIPSQNIATQSYARMGIIQGTRANQGASFEQELQAPQVKRYGRGNFLKVATGYQCRICGRVIRHMNNTTAHMRIHANIKPYKCQVCGQQFKYEVDRRYHVSKVHADLISKMYNFNPVTQEQQ